MTFDALPIDHFRVEVAFTTDPDSATPAYQDITSKAVLGNGITITRGRADEQATVQASTCSLTLDNIDGAFTAGYTGSPYYPNVKPNRKMRVTYRNPTDTGNFIDAASASFESGTGSWATLGTATFAQDTLHTADGSKSLRIDWAVTASTSGVRYVVTGLTIGRTYTLSATMWVPVGGEAVSLNINGIGFGATTSTTGAPQRISTQFTATATAHTVNVYQLSVGTAYSSWVDAILLDEGTNTVFTTAAPPISYRFTGFVEEWPTEWPTGLDTYAKAQIGATDLLSRIGAKRVMKSVIEEAVLYLGPVAYYPLGEATGSTKAGDVSGALGAGPLSVMQLGSGGTLDFGTATGPPTDALPAPTFTPSSSTNGKYLAGAIPGVGGINSASLRASFLTSVTAQQSIARVMDVFGVSLELEVTAAGKLRGHLYSGFSGDYFSITSAASVQDGLTHDAFLTLSMSGGTVSVVLYIDGFSAGTASFSATLLPLFNQVRVGGTSDGALFNGTVCHVAAFNSVPQASDVTEVYTSTSTGFAGERSDQRIARYAKWAGIPTSSQNLETGISASIALTDTTGLSVLQAMQDVAQTESGRLFVDGAGNLTMRARWHAFYNPGAVATITADILDPSARFSMSTQYVVNDVTGQRPNGPDVRAFDTASKQAYGVHDQQVTLLVTSDDEVTNAVNWRVQSGKDPQMRLPYGTFDLYTDSTGSRDQMVLLELGDRITISQMPAQAPSSTVDLVLEGYTETVGLDGWSMAANLSNYGVIRAWVWDVNKWDDGSKWIY